MDHQHTVKREMQTFNSPKCPTDLTVTHRQVLSPTHITHQSFGFPEISLLFCLGFASDASQVRKLRELGHPPRQRIRRPRGLNGENSLGRRLRFWWRKQVLLFGFGSVFSLLVAFLGFVFLFSVHFLGRSYGVHPPMVPLHTVLHSGPISGNISDLGGL